MTAEDKAKNAGKVALVLEGGSFRGQFTAGVLDVLMEAGVEIPAVYGVSAGALNGVNYKSHQIGRANRINLAFCNDSRFMGAASFASTGKRQPLHGRRVVCVHGLYCGLRLYLQRCSGPPRSL